MGGFVRGVRFLVGVALIAAGVVLAAPAGRLVTAAWSAAQAERAAASGLGPAQPTQPAAPAFAPPQGVPQPAPWLVPEQALPPPVQPRADYIPPQPPDRLPAVPAATVVESPALNGTYRSTLQVPPPPLLDAHAAPPAATPWTAATAARPPAPVAESVPAPSTYVIRDGDDLAGIASRFYGHPGAAVSLWDANRDLITDPELLPIGAEIRLPPPWVIRGTPQAAAAGRSIEPPPAAVGPRQVDAVPVSSPWLAGQSVAPQAPAAPAHRATIRLGPGETLETLAERFYGDRRAAATIWEANRDRLRSAELAVPGMELRLP